MNNLNLHRETKFQITCAAPEGHPNSPKVLLLLLLWDSFLFLPPNHPLNLEPKSEEDTASDAGSEMGWAGKW